ncbi:MAG: hypothetical protein IT379_17680 [Deltaproteobacteria bacterium]|nr:hypothetical protein [Deltaproteobacteria bacterium]
MELLLPDPDVLPYGLRAMKAVALANGTFDDSERTFFDAALSLFGLRIDVDALEPIEPEELARHVVDRGLRRQLVRAMVLLSVVDGEASPAEASLVERYANALGIASLDLTTLRHLADGHLMNARFDIARRFWAREKAVELTRQKGLGWLARSVAAMAGLRADREIGDRWRGLGSLPAGTLGRSYFEFMYANDFSFPGEQGSPPEVIAFHDLTHVLSGYGTDPAGEMCVLAFHAGCRREEKDPFSFLMFGLAQFHMGLQLTPVSPGRRGAFDPAPVMLALRRGAGCRIDPTDGWDPWPVMHRPLDALRLEYGIAPLPSPSSS